jgi:hypothetical protein
VLRACGSDGFPSPPDDRRAGLRPVAIDALGLRKMRKDDGAAKLSAIA